MNYPYQLFWLSTVMTIQKEWLQGHIYKIASLRVLIIFVYCGSYVKVSSLFYWTFISMGDFLDKRPVKNFIRIFLVPFFEELAWMSVAGMLVVQRFLFFKARILDTTQIPNQPIGERALRYIYKIDISSKFLHGQLKSSNYIGNVQYGPPILRRLLDNNHLYLLKCWFRDIHVLTICFLSMQHTIHFVDDWQLYPVWRRCWCEDKGFRAGGWRLGLQMQPTFEHMIWVSGSKSRKTQHHIIF